MAVRVPGTNGACRHERGLIDESAVKSGGFRYRLTGLRSGQRQRSRSTPGRIGSTATDARPRPPSPALARRARRGGATEGRVKRQGVSRCERVADASGTVVEMCAGAAGRAPDEVGGALRPAPAPGRMSALRRRRNAYRGSRRVAPRAETESGRQAGRGRSAPTELRRERVADLDKVALPGLARRGAPVTGDSVEEVGRGDAALVHERPLEVPARAPPAAGPVGTQAGGRGGVLYWYLRRRTGIAPAPLPAGEPSFGRAR